MKVSRPIVRSGEEGATVDKLGEPTAILRSGVRSLKVVWLASTCCVSVTLPDRVSISAAWSTSWSWYCW